MISRVSHHKTVNLIFVKNWILEAFDITLSNAQTCEYMKRLGFKSKRAQRSIIISKEANRRQLIEWLEDIRLFIKENEIPPSGIVCMDQICLWDCGISLK